MDDSTIKQSNDSARVLIQREILYPEILWERPVHYYKVKAGRILVIAGSRGMAGAALLTCEAAFRSGTGILTLAFPEELKANFTGVLPEAMTLALPQTHSGSISRRAKEAITGQLKSIDLIIIGPGLSTNTESVQFVWELLQELNLPVVIDADGLKALAFGIDAIRSKKGMDEVKNYFEKLKAKIIITPHPGEASKILEALGEKTISRPDYIEKHKEKVSETIQKNIGGLTVIKGHGTVIFDGEKMVIDKIGGPELATGGSGDVLSGIIGSFVAQNPNKIFEATATAVYLHSLAGRLAKEKLAGRSVTASDIIRFLPEAIKQSED